MERIHRTRTPEDILEENTLLKKTLKKVKKIYERNLRNIHRRQTEDKRIIDRRFQEIEKRVKDNQTRLEKLERKFEKTRKLLTKKENLEEVYSDATETDKMQIESSENNN